MYTFWNNFKSTYSNILLLLQPLHQQIKKMLITHKQYISHDITWVVCLFENTLLLIQTPKLFSRSLNVMRLLMKAITTL